MIFDIDELSQKQDILTASKESIAIALCLIDDGVIVTDEEDRIILINEVAESLVGWNADEAISRHLDEVLNVIDETTYMPYHSSLILLHEKGKIDTGFSNTMLISRDGKKHIIASKSAAVYDKDGNITGFVLILWDITEKRKVEAEFLNICSIAVEIAHKFNNILTVIMGNISLAKRHANQSDIIYEKLMEVEHASLQAKGLMQRLQAFPREILAKGEW